MQEQFWRAFTASGDPLTYLEFTRNREKNRNITKGQKDENHKSTRFSD